MKKNTRSILQKMIIILLIIIFLFPNYSSAESVGGKLIDPINDFLVGIGDGFINVLQKVIMGGDYWAITYRVYNNAYGLLDNISSWAVDLPITGSVGQAIGTWIFGSEAYDEADGLSGIIAVPLIKFGPATIFSNQIELFDVNFFNPISSQSTAGQLKNVVAFIYNSLRIIAVVGLLSVLVFIGIKILLGTVSNNNKAKYKEMLMDWLVAICLVFVMHYIMSAAVTLVNKLTDIFDITLTTSEGLDVSFNVMRGEITKQELLSNQMARFGYIIIYLSMIICTVIFAFQYLKRVIYMAFLTMIAPLVALTYPIDKINDGKAQAFNMWFKEYMFNLLIQPLHLIIYSVLIISAQELAKSNVIYAIVAIGFMVPAEKLLRRFFGFEKAQTPGGLLAGPVGLATTMGLANKLFSKGSSSSKSKTTNNEKTTSNDNDNSIKYKNNFEDEMPGLDDYNLNNNMSDNSDKESKNNSTDDEYNNINNNREKLDKDNLELKNNEDNREINNGIEKEESWTQRKIRGINKASDRIRLLRAGRHYMRGIANKKPIRRLAKSVGKSVGKAGVGIVGTGLGLAAGMASGDATKAAQYAIAGGTGGYKVAGNLENDASKIKSALSVEGTAKAYYGEEEYKKKQIQRNIENAKKDNKLKQVLDSEFGYERAREIREQVLPDCINYGLTDYKDIITVAKMDGVVVDGRKINKEDAIRSVIQINNFGKNTEKLGAKDSEDLDKTLINRALKNSRVTSDEQAKKVAKRTRQLMDTASKIKYKL